MSSADTFTVNHSMERETNEFIFEKKEMLYTVDSNNGSYGNGQIIFDLASLSNCGRPVDFRNSTLVIPYSIKLSGGGLDDNAVNCFAVSMKNHIHTIDSMSVQISNHNVIEPQEFSNIPCSFKLLTEMSEQELKQFGYSMGFHKDNALSLKYAGADTQFAPNTFEYNNNTRAVLTQPVNDNTFGNDTTLSAFSANGAVMERMLDSSLDLTVYNQSQASNMIASGKRHCFRYNGYVLWHGLITLQLRFLSDFFDKMPLVRNSYVKMNITTNLISKSVLTTTAGGAYSALVSSLSAKTCPYMVSPLGRGLTPDGAGSITVESGIGCVLSDANNTRNPIFTACRLYTPVYTLTPSMEERYFSQAPKQILYSSYFRAVTPPIANGGALNSFLVTNALSRIRSILVFPVAANQNNMLSPFSSCPSTTMPYALISNFNVRIGGSPHYSESQFYGWEQFKEEISARGVNGNLELGLGSGLLNELEWNAGYRFLYVDLSRKSSQGQDDVAKSVILEGINRAGIDVVYHVFVEYQKSVTISQSTGQLILS